MKNFTLYHPFPFFSSSFLSLPFLLLFLIFSDFWFSEKGPPAPPISPSRLLDGAGGSFKGFFKGFFKDFILENCG